MDNFNIIYYMFTSYYSYPEYRYDIKKHTFSQFAKSFH